MKPSTIITAGCMAGVGLAAPAKVSSGLEQRISNQMSPVDDIATRYTLSNDVVILENTSPSTMTKREAQTFGLILDWLKKAYGLDDHCVCPSPYRKREEQTFGLIYDLIRKVLGACGIGQDNCHCNSYGSTYRGSSGRPTGGSSGRPVGGSTGGPTGGPTGGSIGSFEGITGDGSGFGAVLGPILGEVDGSGSTNGKGPDIASVLSSFLGKDQNSGSGTGATIGSTPKKGPKVPAGGLAVPGLGSGIINSTAGKTETPQPDDMNDSQFGSGHGFLKGGDASKEKSFYSYVYHPSEDDSLKYEIMILSSSKTCDHTKKGKPYTNAEIQDLADECAKK